MKRAVWSWEYPKRLFITGVGDTVLKKNRLFSSWSSWSWISPIPK